MDFVRGLVAAPTAESRAYSTGIKVQTKPLEERWLKEMLVVITLESSENWHTCDVVRYAHRFDVVYPGATRSTVRRSCRSLRVCLRTVEENAGTDFRHPHMRAQSSRELHDAFPTKLARLNTGILTRHRLTAGNKSRGSGLA